MIYETTGWIGTILIVVAYFLVSNDLVSSSGLMYQIMNVLGALFMGISVFKKTAWASFGLQIVWFVIGTIAIAKIIF
ncbi:MAG: hypothetical protein US76_02240 [Parcubacteria group bacterium GW2011_GWA2_38_13b]|nr:MAG: hypothetical protein US76_02240 [Parcubacteria group bacterium GW2011_GWA2_38_13b]